MSTTISAAWRGPIDLWLIELSAQALSKDTRYTRRQHLEHAARRLGDDPWAITGPDLVLYVATQDWMPETIRAHRTSLRGFYQWATREGHVDESPALALPRVKPSAPNPRPAPDSVYHPALAEADPREVLLMRLAAEHGLRRGECVQVHPRRDMVEDLTGWSLVVHGKGGKERTVPLLDDVARLLLSLPPGYAFPGAVDGHLSARWAGKLINRLLPGDWTIHKLRHRAGTSWWEASDRDLLLVAELLGHASVSTTQRYVKDTQRRHRAVIKAAAGRQAA